MAGIYLLRASSIGTLTDESLAVEGFFLFNISCLLLYEREDLRDVLGDIKCAADQMLEQTEEPLEGKHREEIAQIRRKAMKALGEEEHGG